MICIIKVGDAARILWRGLRAASRDKVYYTIYMKFLPLKMI
jgi:hypothetical protein